MPCNCGRKKNLKPPPPLPIVRHETKTQYRRLHFVNLKPVNIHEKIKKDVERLGQRK